MHHQQKEKLRRKEIRKSTLPVLRQSERCTPNSKEIEELKATISRQNEEIEELCLLLDTKEKN